MPRRTISIICMLYGVLISFFKDFIYLMESSIAAKLNECSCSITADDLQDTSIVCNGGKKVIFSSESGDETASTLTNRMTQQASVSSLTLPVSGSESVITSACSDDCFLLVLILGPLWEEAYSVQYV